MVDTHLLRYFISKNGDTVESLAAYLNIKRGALSAKMNNKRDFKLSEVVKISRKYKLSFEQIHKLFWVGTGGELCDCKRSS